MTNEKTEFQKFLDEWPGGLEEVEASIAGHKRIIAAKEREIEGLRSELAQRGKVEPVALTAWFGSMPESNGKANWTVMLHRKGSGIFDESITIERTEFKDRARYEYDRIRYLLGEVAERPDILDYDGNLKESAPQAEKAPSVQAVEMSPEFTDTARAALLWVLWHHQGGSSPVGQPIRFALGMGQHDRLNEHQLFEAKRWEALHPVNPSVYPCGAAPQQPSVPDRNEIEAMAFAHCPSGKIGELMEFADALIAKVKP